MHQQNENDASFRAKKRPVVSGLHVPDNSKLFICKNGSDCRIPGPGVGVFEEREILQWTLLLFNVCESLGRVFRVRPRAKRLLRPADEDLEQDRAPLTASESASGLSSTNRAKASKSLQFSSKDISTTCVSSTNSKQPLPVGVRRLAYFPKVGSPIQPVENQNYRPTEFKSVDGSTRLLQFANKLALLNVNLDHEGKNSNTF